ncbi:MAG: gamma-glutamylcyclotransferase [Gammaproteobacteria bacterium]|nr:gamma-glutamylcyclotransferase [Gammaproteobacteria bacterium]NNF66608.1 gamma-glutamylcyclotransferase [Gammaproteobacteria bacterium]
MRLRIRIPSARFVAATELPGYALCFHKRSNIDGSGKCTLLSSQQQQVYTAIYEIAPSALSKLDQIEGVGAGYERRVVSVPQIGPCHAYFATESHLDSSLQPFTWYKNLVLAGCRALDFPAMYTESIKKIGSADDPSVARAVRHALLLRKLRKVAIQVAAAGV